MPIAIATSKPISREYIAYLFIDGAYLREIYKKIRKINDVFSQPDRYAAIISTIISNCPKHQHLREYFDPAKLRIARTYYYDAIVRKEDDAEQYMKQKNFFDLINERVSQSRPFECKFEELIKRTKKAKAKYHQKGVDTLLAIDMISKGYKGHYELAFLLAGDRDFLNVVKTVKDDIGKWVCGIYYKKETAKELVDLFDFKIDISSIIKRR